MKKDFKDNTWKEILNKKSREIEQKLRTSLKGQFYEVLGRENMTEKPEERNL
jgi:hypothetical protein